MKYDKFVTNIKKATYRYMASLICGFFDDCRLSF